MNKKRKIIIIVLAIFILLIAIGVFLLFKSRNDEDITLTFKEVTTLEYGYDINDLLEEEINCDDECIYYNKLLEYSIEESIEGLGLKDIHVIINYNGNTYEHYYYGVLVKDSENPALILTKEEDSIVINSSINEEEYIASVSDNYDNLSNADVLIENNVQIDEIGDYEIIYSVSDSSGNVTKAILTIHVVEEDEEEKTETVKTSNANTNNNTESSTKDATSENNTGNTSFESAINSVSLNSIKTRNTSLDNLVSNIISSTTSSSGTNYEKVVALYDYVKSYLSYKTPVLSMSLITNLQDDYHYTYYDAKKVLYAEYALENKTGSCDSYAALLLVLLRRVGFDAYMVSGYVKTTSGGTTGHSWVMLKANGTYYILDAQIEDSKGTSYNYFGKTSTELNIYTYDLSSNISEFNYFKEITPLTSTLSITGSLTKDYSLTSYSSETIKETIKDIEVGDTINLTLTGNSGYTYIVRNGSEEITSGTFNGSAVSVSYTFKESGTNIIYIDIKNGEYVFGYYQLSFVVNDTSVVKITKMGYKKSNGYIIGTITVTDGYAPYTYTAEIIETDDNDASITVSDNTYSINYQTGKYYKVKVTVTDSLGSTASSEINIT